MRPLQITLFGHITVIHPARSAPLKLPRSSQTLLAYLLLQQTLVSRDILIDTFWENSAPNQAHSSLTTAIWRLRKVLEPPDVQPGTYLITKSSGEVGFNRESSHLLDTVVFEQQVDSFLNNPLSALQKDEVGRMEETLALYRGELLEGIYEDWALRERERFHLLHLNCLARLMEYHASQDHIERSLMYGQEILRWDPLREDIHRKLMRLYLQNDQHILAIRQYLHCWELLNQELGISPLEETQMLYHQAIDLSPPGLLTSGQSVSPDIAQLTQELQLAKRSLSDVTSILSRIAKTLNHIVQDDLLGLRGKQEG